MALSEIQLKEMEALSRLVSVGGFLIESICEDLATYRLISKETSKKIKTAYSPIEELYKEIHNLRSDESNFIEISWTILPSESIRLRVITDVKQLIFSF